MNMPILTVTVKSVQVKITWTGKYLYEIDFNTYNNISPSTVYINQVGSYYIFQKVGTRGTYLHNNNNKKHTKDNVDSKYIWIETRACGSTNQTCPVLTIIFSSIVCHSLF